MQGAHARVEVGEHVVGDDREAPNSLGFRNDPYKASEKRLRGRDDALRELQALQRPDGLPGCDVDRLTLVFEKVANIFEVRSVAPAPAHLRGGCSLSARAHTAPINAQPSQDQRKAQRKQSTSVQCWPVYGNL